MPDNGKTSKLPVMPLYVRDWLAATRDMSLVERGIYMDLLCYSWINGPLPKSLSKLKRMCGPWVRTKALLNALSHFKSVPAGYINERLESERQNVTVAMEKRASMARYAATERWKKNTDSNADRTAHGSAHRMPSPSSIENSAPYGAGNSLSEAEGAKPTPTPGGSGFAHPPLRAAGDIARKFVKRKRDGDEHD